MALQWFLLGAVAGVEAAILLLLSAPLPRGVANQILDIVKKILQPGLAVIPFALFQLMGKLLTSIMWNLDINIASLFPA
jgi:hypothetical protein